MIEYYEDAIERDPGEEFPRLVRESGLYAHRTGDAVIDRWQEDAARGRSIDVDLAFTDPEQRRQFEAAKAASRARHRARTGQVVDGDGDEEDH